MSRTLGNPVAVMAASLLAACLACVCSSTPAAAALADVRGGVYSAQGGFALGAGLIQRVKPGTTWYFNPNLEAAFTDGSVVSVNADVHYDFPTRTRYSLYAGAGPALIVTSPEHRDSETDAGLNVLGGVNWREQSLRPFVQMKGVISDQGQVAIMGGVRF